MVAGRKADCLLEMPRRQLRSLFHGCGRRPSEANNECWKRAVGGLVTRRKVDCRDALDLHRKRMAPQRRLRLGGRGDATRHSGRCFLAVVALSRCSDHRSQPADGYSPVWSPDATKLVFSRRQGGLVITNADGLNATILTAGGHPPPGGRSGLTGL